MTCTAALTLLVIVSALFAWSLIVAGIDMRSLRTLWKAPDYRKAPDYLAAEKWLSEFKPTAPEDGYGPGHRICLEAI